jgi:hypothetical protein
MNVTFTASIPESTLPPGKAIYQNLNQVSANIRLKWLKGS